MLQETACTSDRIMIFKKVVWGCLLAIYVYNYRMKDRLPFEDQIKKAKSSNKHYHKIQHLESSKEKKSESSQQYSVKIMHISKLTQKPPLFHKHYNNKVIVIQTLENDINNNEPPQMMIASSKHKHKKGKSMDLTAEKSLATDRNQVLVDQKPKNARKASIPSCVINEFRYKSNISEMKDYNLSKRLESTRKKWSQLPVPNQAKKVKLDFSGEFKQLKRQLRGIIYTQPKTKRKTSTGKMSNQTCKPKQLSKQVAATNKSLQLCLGRQKSHDERDELFVSKLLKKGTTLPLFSRLQSLYSNTTSLFSSKTNLSSATHHYAISTEQSIDQIFEIRQFQSQALTKTHLSNKDLRKSNSTHNKQLPVSDSKNTPDLISSFVKMIAFQGKSQTLSHLSRQIQTSMDFLNISKDLANKHETNSQQSLRTPPNSQQIYQTVLHLENNSANSHQASYEVQLEQLNQIIRIIQTKQVLNAQQKHQILQKIKKIVRQPQKRHASSKANNIANNSQIFKQCKPFVQATRSSNINIEILDRILKDRQKYLVQTKRNKEMMKCLSERYLNHHSQSLTILPRQQIQPIDKANHTQIKQAQTEPQQVDKQIESIKQNDFSHDKDVHLLSQDANNSQNQLQSASSQNHQQKLSSNQKSLFKQPKFRGLPSYANHSIIDQDEQIVTPHKRQFIRSENSYRIDSIDPKTSNSAQQNSYEYPFHNFGELNSAMQMTASLEKIEYIDDSPFSNLTLENKQDITEFVFLDLCIQLTQHYSRDSPILTHIFNFIQRAKQQSKRQKGFKTNSNAIKDYLSQLLVFIKSQSTLLQQIYTNMDQPIGPSALQILKFMHISDSCSQPSDQPEQNINILTSSIFELFEQRFIETYQFQKYYDDQQKQRKRILFLKNAIHVHNKAIFDTLNERLDTQRPFGLWGRPFAWKKTPKFFPKRSLESKDQLIYMSAQRAIQFASYLCGFIVDKEDCSFGDNPNVTASYLQQIRIDRLSRMLAQQLQQDEQKMQFIDDQETELQIQLSDAIWNKLLSQFQQVLSLL